MSGALAELEPQLLWRHFLALTRIPRPPKSEEKARAHVLAWAEAQGFETDVDDAGNAVVRVPASSGREEAPVVVLQSHLDMVCERDPTSPNDPREGRIDVAQDGDWLVARDTTLGADDGIGVAAAMAVAEDAGLVQGPLELLFTVSEEEGLEGAKALDAQLVRGRILINLDGTSNDSLTVGCAGSAHTFVTFELDPMSVPQGWRTLAVRLQGARGGHSGGDIATGRVNAIKALGRVLGRERQVTGGVRVAYFGGGVSRNAIPREAEALVVVEPSAEPALRAAIEDEAASLRAQFADTDDAIVVTVQDATPVTSAAGEAATARLLDLVSALPTGVLAMSPSVAGTVETSTSLTVAGTEDGAVTLASMTRSANAEALEEVVATIESTARLAGATTEIVRAYAPWEPDLGSQLLARARGTYERLFDREPKLEVVHGGLECAVIGDKLQGVEMISIGPDVQGMHAPGERVSVSGGERFYRFLCALLDDLSA